MAALDLNPQNDNKENVSPSEMTTTSVKPLDSSSSIDKEKTQIRIIRRKRSRRQPLKDITNLFVSSSSPLSSSFLIRHFPSSQTLSVDPKCMKRRSVVALKASSTFSCRNFR